MTRRHAPLALLTAAFSACSAVPTPHAPASDGVVLSESAPPAGYVALGPLSVKSGKGCGVFGESGSRQDAEIKLRNEASKLGASYVFITVSEAPRPNHQCMEHEYKLSGVAYRASGVSTVLASRSSAPAPAPAPVPVPVAARACIAGVTQACLGPGACQGAQACRDDGTGFLPCDCGTPAVAPPP